MDSKDILDINLKNELIYNWKEPYSIKIKKKFIHDKHYTFLQNLIDNKKFYKSCQTSNNKQIVQENHKIRLDYTLTNKECSYIDDLVLKADCKCNLRERWRLLYYNGDDEVKPFRDAHTDWTKSCCHRRMSIVIGLSEQNTYVGGELVFPNDNISIKLNKGDVIIFDSRLLHEVLPVTSGKRYVLQAFLFDKSGYDVKTIQHGIENFKLLFNNLNNNNEIMDDNIKSLDGWTYYNNKNLGHSKIKDYTKNYLGSFDYINDIEKTLLSNPHITHFVWHKPELYNTKWRKRLYGWTKEDYENNINTIPRKLRTEKYTLSGFRNIINSPSNNITSKLNNTLSIITNDGGPGNQIVGIKEGLMISIILNRKFIFPPIVQHYTINRNKYFKFNELFKYDDKENIELVDNIEHIKKNNIVYTAKSSELNKKICMEKLLNINNNKVILPIRKFEKIRDIEKLKDIVEDNLIISSLYNNIKISECFWNGCDDCSINPDLIKLYKDICSKFNFSDNIIELGNNYIKRHFNKENYIALHVRYADFDNGKNIKDINKLYNEKDINNIIHELSDKYDINKNNIFIATNNKKNILNSYLNNYKIYKNKNNNDIDSFVEQYICCMSKIFIYTGGIHAKPEHIHLRSTWSSFVLDYRYCILNKNKDSHIYITNYLQNKEKHYGYVM